MKIYLSSTYMDLKHHRAVVGKALRSADYEVVMMEETVARDQRVEFACQGDVLQCDVYVGVFAWRYGYVPDEDNPRKLSVTEMEYEAAGSKPMPRLTFLLNDNARWKEDRKDADPGRIEALRERLKKRYSGYFSTANDLVVEVLTALRVNESSRLAQQLSAVDMIRKTQGMGPSFITNLEARLNVLSKEPFIELQLGPTPWWNTRLYLVAALAKEFERPRGIVFVTDERQYICMASPQEILHRLALRWPELERAYSRFRKDAGAVETIDEQLWRYPVCVAEELGADEEEARHVLSQQDVEYELGMARNAEVVDPAAKNQRFLQREILGRQTPYVALVRDGRLEGLVDRNLLAQRVAQAVLG